MNWSIIFLSIGVVILAFGAFDIKQRIEKLESLIIKISLELDRNEVIVRRLEQDIQGMWWRNNK
jgi:hypothetical protein